MKLIAASLSLAPKARSRAALVALGSALVGSALVGSALVGSALVGSALVAGCGKGNSAEAAGSAAASSTSVKDQCAALKKANDTWSDKLTKQKDTDNPAKDAQVMVKNVDDWAGALGKLTIDDAGLKKLTTEEQGILKDMSASLKELSGILAKLDDKKAPDMDEKAIDALQKQMDALEKKQDASQKSADAMDDKIDKYCADK